MRDWMTTGSNTDREDGGNTMLADVSVSVNSGMDSLTTPGWSGRLFVCMQDMIKRAYKQTLVFSAALLISANAVAVAPGTVINNTATAAYSVSAVPGFTATSNIDTITTTVALTPATVAFYQYNPVAPTITTVLPTISSYANGAAAGPLVGMGNPSYVQPGVGPTVIDVANPVPLSPANSYHQGDPVFVYLTDANRNIDINARDTVQVTLTVAATGDAEVIEFVETGNNTGVFIGYIQSTAAAATSYDGVLSVAENSMISVTYTDTYDVTDTANAQALVDPFGIVFDSVIGAALDGATVRMVDAVTGLDATVYGDDGVSIYPATVVTGTGAVDSGANVYSFPAGGYRFPLLVPGSYRLEVTPPASYSVPSALTIATIQATTPGAPFALDVNASYQLNFVINAGPPLNVDIPADPGGSGLVLSKTASKDKVSIGEFVRYNLALTNNNLAVSTATIINDTLPRGLKYIEGSAHLDKIAIGDPVMTANGKQLAFAIGDIAASATVNLSYVVGVDAESGGQRLTNTAVASNSLPQQSNVASVDVIMEQELLNTRSHVLGRVMSGNCAAEPVKNGFVDMRLQSDMYGEALQYTINITGTTVPVTGVKLRLHAPKEIELNRESIQITSAESIQPIKDNGDIILSLGNQSGNWNQQIQLRARLNSDKPGTYNVEAELIFDSPTQKAVSIKAINSVLREVSSGERKSMVTLSRYDKSRVDLNLSDRIELKTLADEIKGRVVKRVRVMGHTDAVAISNGFKDKYDDNYGLSLARAKAAAKFLRKNIKFNTKKLQIQGFGPDMAVASNNTEEGRRANRRVEVEVVTTHGKKEYQTKLLRSDSGIKRARTETVQPQKTEALLGGELKGIEGVRIVTEEGIYSVTDKDGLYHIEGLRPGTHVLQVDEASLPDHLEVMLCEENTRFAGSGNSQFVDLQGGSLWRSDFYLKKKDPIKAQMDLQMRSVLEGPLAHFTLDVYGRKFDYRDASVLVVIPEELQYMEGSLYIGNKKQNEADIKDGIFTVKLGNYINEAWKKQIRFSAHAAGTKDSEEIVTRATAMFKTTEGKRHRTPYAENSLLHSPQAGKQKQFIFRPRFDSARAKLKRSDKIRLDQILKQFKNEEVIHIKVAGHADSVKLRGNAKRRWGSNKELSRNRAAAVANYIKQKLKLNDGQMAIEAMGDVQPIASNSSKEGRAINRRVELFVRTKQENEAGIWKPVDQEVCPVYVTAQYRLNENNKQKLDALATEFKGKKIRRIRIVGHTDSKNMSEQTKEILKDNYELSRRRAETVAQHLSSALGLKKEQVVIEVLGPAQPVADNGTENGRARNRRVEVFVERIDMRAMTEKGPDWKLVRADSGIQTVKLKREVESHKRVLPEAPKPAINNYKSYDKAWLARASLDTAWLAPQAGYIPEIPTTHVAIQHSATTNIDLSVNGQKVGDLNFEGMLKNGRGVGLSRWRSIPLQDGKNEMVAIVRDSSGIEITRLARTLYYAGGPAKAEYVAQYSHPVANGRDPILIGLKLTDRFGQPARPGTTGRFTVNDPYMAQSLADALNQNPVAGAAPSEPDYIVMGDGVAQLRIKPTTHSGKLSVRLTFNNDVQQDIDVWVMPVQRDWVLVGLAEGTAGYHTLKGNMTALQDQEIEEGYYDDGRLAFYAKGSIKGEWLLTAAYDSKKEKDTPDAVLHGLIEPDKYYTLYGDGAERSHDAASTEKLYFKLERNQFYALYGDYNTGMTVTELSRYSRSMTGLKSEYQGERFSYNAFVSETEYGFIKDEIRGDGTSGLYRLSHQNIIANSEKIVIETRDRFNSHVILNSRSMSRFLDYNIDPVAGTIFFKEPIFSQDGGFNPIYIVADYEVQSGAEASVIAGGRAAVKFMDGKVEVGASAVHEGIEGAEANLGGIDATIKIGEHSIIRAESATTDQQVGTTDREGDAWLAEYEYADKKVNAKAYVREQDQGFGLGQQKGSETGTRKYGVLGKYQLDSEFSVQGEYRHEDVLATDATRDVAEARVNYSARDYALSGGLRHAADEDGAGVDHDSQQLTLGGSYYFFNRRASLRANAEFGLGSDADANPDYPSRYILGGDFKLTQATKVFLEQEWTMGAAQDTEATRAGFETLPWQGAALRSDVTNEYSEAGARTYSNLGLKQGFKLNDHVSLDFGVDRRKTLREPGDVPFNVNVPPANGTLDNDYTAVSMGATYRHDRWSATGRAENRTADKEDKNTVLLGFYRENGQGVGFAAKYNWFGREEVGGLEESQKIAELSLAYRPADSHWNVLDKLKAVDNQLLDASGETLGRKYVNNMNVNYLLGRSGQLAMHWGLKQVIDTFEEGEFDGLTQTLGLEYRHDLTSWWDLGIQGSVIDVDIANNQRYSYGVSTGFNVVRGVWLSLGYNKEGFEDKDFSTAGYSAAGPYLKFRMSFDHYTSRRVMAWWERDDKPADLNQINKVTTP